MLISEPIKSKHISNQPNDWNRHLLEEICQKITDGSHFSPVPQEEGRWIGNVKDMTEFGFDYDTCTKIHEKDFQLLKKQNCSPKKGDVLLSKDGTIGRVIFYNTITEMVVLSSIAIIRPKGEYDGNFLSHLLKSEYFKRQLIALESGSALRRIVLRDIKSLEFTMPAQRVEQTTISNILNTVDLTIGQTEKLIDKYKHLKTGLMHDFLTKGIDSKGSIRSKATHKFVKKQGIEVPEEWEVKSLYEVAKIIVSNVDKKTHEGEIKVSLCNYMDVYSNREISKSISFMEASASNEEIEKFKLKLNDVIITKDSETPNDIAVPAVVKETFENLICGYHLALLRPNENLNGYFLMFQFLQHSAKIHFGTLATGSTRFGLSIGAIQKFKVVIPEIKEQEQIVQRVTKIDILIDQETNYLNKQYSLKTGLMQDLLSGKVRVK